MIQNFDDVKIIKFDLLNKYNMIKHGFSTRSGGVSENEFASMNLGFNRGDSKENVIKNFQIISEKLGIPYENLVLSSQTHTTNLRIVTKEDKGKGILKEKDYEDIDGLITNEKNIGLVTFYADCIPLIFFDPVKEVIATSHSGWKGTVNRMGKATVEKMVSEFSCKREDIIACIGPGICKDCYEVSKDVAEQFLDEFQNEEIHKIVFEEENEKYFIDLKEANKQVLLSAGIIESNIEDAEICTCCNSELLFSHRASGGKRGNLAAFIMMSSPA